MITLLEVLTVIGIVIALCYHVPYFYLAAHLTTVGVIIKIISSDDNPDYKVPWLLFVMIVPIAGFMLYFLFYSRKLHPKYIKRLKGLHTYAYRKDDSEHLEILKQDDPMAASQAKMLTEIADTHVFADTKADVFPPW